MNWTVQIKIKARKKQAKIEYFMHEKKLVKLEGNAYPIKKNGKKTNILDMQKKSPILVS